MRILTRRGLEGLRRHPGSVRRGRLCSDAQDVMDVVERRSVPWLELRRSWGSASVVGRDVLCWREWCSRLVPLSGSPHHLDAHTDCVAGEVQVPLWLSWKRHPVQPAALPPSL